MPEILYSSTISKDKALPGNRIGPYYSLAVCFYSL